jgi:hypothetical protein
MEPTCYIAKEERSLLYMQDKYIVEINELLKTCNDISLLDFIFRLLKKHPKQAEAPDASQVVA